MKRKGPRSERIDLACGCSFAVSGRRGDLEVCATYGEEYRPTGTGICVECAHREECHEIAPVEGCCCDPNSWADGMPPVCPEFCLDGEHGDCNRCGHEIGCHEAVVRVDGPIDSQAKMAAVLTMLYPKGIATDQFLDVVRLVEQVLPAARRP